MRTSSTSPAPTKCLDEEVASEPVKQPICISDTCCPPFTRTLCGRSIFGPIMEGSEALAECVVCSDMAKARRFCSHCGTECGG